MNPDLFDRRRRFGVTAIYSIVMMFALCGFVSLAVDWGKVQLTKTELQSAADSAARAAAAQLAGGITATRDAAVLWAGYNKAATTAVVIDRVNDVDFGTWDTTTRTFTVLSGAARANANAVRVWARRTAAKGNPVTLTFGPLVGMAACDISTSSIATGAAPAQAITGLNSISMFNNNVIASYNSLSMSSPTQGTASSSAILQSNGTITGGPAHDTLQGNINLGPSGSQSNLSVTGSTNTVAAGVATPWVPTMLKVTNPGGVSATPNVSSSATWPGGTYYFTSLTMGNNASITFTGPAVVYMNGNVTLGNSDTISPYNSRPGNLLWFQASGTTFNVGNNATIGADISAPGTDFVGLDNMVFMGAMTFKTIDVHNNNTFYMDSSLATATGSVSIVK